MIDIQDDNRPRRKGWAPGNYLCRCLRCDKRFGGDKRALSCADCAYADWTPTHRHGKTGGLYRLTDQRVTIEATMQRAVIYEGQDGTLWARPEAEFFDGRFATIEDGPAAETPGVAS